MNHKLILSTVGLVFFVESLACAQNGSIQIQFLNEKGRSVSEFRYDTTALFLSTKATLLVPLDEGVADFFWNPYQTSINSWTPHRFAEASGEVEYEVVTDTGSVVATGTTSGRNVTVRNVPPGGYVIRGTARMQILEKVIEETSAPMSGTIIPPSWRETDSRWNGPVMFKSVTRTSVNNRQAFEYVIIRDVIIQTSQRTYVDPSEADKAVLIFPKLTQIYDGVRTVPQTAFDQLASSQPVQILTGTAIKSASKEMLKQFFNLSDSSLQYLAGVPATLIYAGMTPETDLTDVVLQSGATIGTSLVVGQLVTAGVVSGGNPTIVLGAAIGITVSFAIDNFWDNVLLDAVAASVADDLIGRRVAGEACFELFNEGQDLSQVRLMPLDRFGINDGNYSIAYNCSNGCSVLFDQAESGDLQALVPLDPMDAASSVWSSVYPALQFKYPFPGGTRTLHCNAFGLRPLPNFSITRIVLVPSRPLAGRTFAAKITVRNLSRQGGALGRVDGYVNEPELVDFGMEGDGSYETGLTLGGLNQATITLSGLQAPGDAGSFTFRAVADSQDRSWETFETDNQATLQYTVVAGPSVPTALAPMGEQFSKTLMYSWTAAARATTYELRIEAQSSPGGAWRSWKTTTGLRGTSTTVAGHVGGASYRWWVRGVNSYASGDWSDALEFAVILPTQKPAKVVAIGPTGMTSDATPTFRWNAAIGAATYTLVVRQGSRTVINQSGINGTSYTSGVPLSAASYTWYVSGVNSFGAGESSNPLSFTVGSAGYIYNASLTWGRAPTDLDSHLLTPEGYHVYWGNKGAQYSPPFASLEVDDTDSYGPENISFYQIQNGTYKYYVNQFSSDGSLAGCGARVVLTDANGAVVLDQIVPSTGDGRYWHVFDIIDGVVVASGVIQTSAP